MDNACKESAMDRRSQLGVIGTKQLVGQGMNDG